MMNEMDIEEVRSNRAVDFRKQQNEEWKKDLEELYEVKAENKKLKALCLRESSVIREALKQKNNKSMLKVAADSLEEASKGE